jgi:hypothetical protein
MARSIAFIVVLIVPFSVVIVVVMIMIDPDASSQ